MKTPEEILEEVAAENMINIQQMVTTKQLVIIAMRRYAKLYHDNEVTPTVVGRSKQLLAFGRYLQKWSNTFLSEEHLKQEIENYLKGK